MSTFTAPDGDTHFALGLAESAACEATAWEHWVGDVENLMGHDADGNQSVDGYSLDALLTLFEAGRTPPQAVAEVGAVVLR